MAAVAIRSGMDRRAFGRKETHIEASVWISRHQSLDCIIRDISEGGALLEFKEPVEFSGRIKLVWPESRFEIQCEVRHARGNRCGVEFVRQIKLVSRPVVPVASTVAPAAPVRHADPVSNVGSKLVALRRQASKAVHRPFPAHAEMTIVVQEFVPVPRDASSILRFAMTQSAAAEPEVPALPRDASSIFAFAAPEAAARIVPPPLPASAYRT